MQPAGGVSGQQQAGASARHGRCEAPPRHHLAPVCRTMLNMLFGSKTPSGQPAGTTPAERDFAEAVKRSDTGQLSVSIDDLSKTQSFKRDLDVLRRIRERSETPTSGR